MTGGIKIILNLGQHFLNLPNMIFHIVIQIFFMKKIKKIKFIKNMIYQMD